MRIHGDSVQMPLDTSYESSCKCVQMNLRICTKVDAYAYGCNMDASARKWIKHKTSINPYVVIGESQ